MVVIVVKIFLEIMIYVIWNIKNSVEIAINEIVEQIKSTK